MKTKKKYKNKQNLYDKYIDKFKEKIKKLSSIKNYREDIYNAINPFVETQSFRDFIINL